MQTRSDLSVANRFSLPVSSNDTEPNSTNNQKNKSLDKQALMPVIQSKPTLTENKPGSLSQAQHTPYLANPISSSPPTLRDRAVPAKQETIQAPIEKNIFSADYAIDHKKVLSLSYGALLPLIKHEVHKKFSELSLDDKASRNTTTKPVHNDTIIATEHQPTNPAHPYPANFSINGNQPIPSPKQDLFLFTENYSDGGARIKIGEGVKFEPENNL